MKKNSIQHYSHLHLIFLALFLFVYHSVFGEVQTIIPIVQLQYNALSKDTFSAAHFSFIDKNDTFSCPIQIRHRGATSTRYEKKSYAIKLFDENGQKMDTSFFGMRTDNYWILEAMASDKARMRNRVAMDLWLDFSSKPYYSDKEPKICNGYNGKFVEVYVNDDYQGIYCLMERIDRKQLKLKKTKSNTINGLLYKGISNKDTFFGGELPPYDNTSITWSRYELHYPDEEDSLIDWGPLYNTMDFAINASVEDFCNEASMIYDIPVFMDYYLFTIILSARDNRGKNVYLSFYNINDNSKLLITPWDIDHSFGRMYNGNEENVDADCSYSGELYKRFERDIPEYRTQLLQRYATLRSTMFSLDALKQRFAEYFNLFRSTLASDRETARWNGVDKIYLDFDYEEEYIYSWLEQRLAYTDLLFQYATPTEDNIEKTSNIHIHKIFHNGQIYILRDFDAYTITGLKVNNSQLYNY